MKTIDLSIHDGRIAPEPKYEYYSDSEITAHKANGFLFAVIDTSYVQFMTAHCVALGEYNDALDAYLTETED